MRRITNVMIIIQVPCRTARFTNNQHSKERKFVKIKLRTYSENDNRYPKCELDTGRNMTICSGLVGIVSSLGIIKKFST